jgi:ABC-type amino acid transport substrate-binding protein
MISHFIFKIVSLVSLLLCFSFVLAETSHATNLVVGTKIAPPFAMKDQNGQWEGISIELWQEIAKQLDYQYQWKEQDLQGLINNISDSQLDVAIAALTINSERETHFDFSHSYYSTGLSIAIPKTPNNAWMTVIKGIFSYKMLLIIIGLSTLLFIIGTMAWLMERKKNPKNFHPSPLKGIASGMWWAAVTMTTVGYGDMTPKTLGGRMVALFWMFASLLLISSIIAGVSSALTVAKITPLVSSPNDLAKVQIATIKNSTSDSYLKSRQLRSDYYPTVIQGLQALSENKVDAMVYDAPLLKYLVKNNFSNNLKVNDNLFELQNYGIAFPENSQHREAVNRVMLAIIHSKRWQEILDKYLGN